MKAIYFLMIPLAILGVFFLSILLHESIHVAQAKEPLNVCWNIGENAFAFTTYNIEAESLHTFKTMEQWEKVALTTQYWFNMLLCFILGWVLNDTLRRDKR